MQRVTLNRFLLAGLAMACLGLSSCATTLSKNECLAMDWRTIGYEDGAHGYPGSRIGVHRKACGEYGVTPDFDAYQKGRNEGLLEFCTAANGYRVGASGGQYGGVCPAEREEDFLMAWSEGHEVHVLRSRVSATSSQLGARRRELDRLQKSVAQNAAAAVDEKTTKDARVDAVLDTAKIAERMGQVKTEIRGLEQDLAQQQQELDDYLAAHPPLLTSR